MVVQKVTKGQYISKWIYEVIVSPQIWTKNCKGTVAVYRAEFFTISRLYFWEKQWLHKFILKLIDL